MKITVIAESNMNDDGIDSKASYEQSGVECLSDLSHVLAEATRAIGFPWVDEVVIKTEEGLEF